MFAARFQIVRGSRRPRRQRAARRGVARRARAARARRLRGAARRPLPERIRAALCRAPRLAHRLYRLGRARDRACRPRRPLRRRPLQVQVREEVDGEIFSVAHLVEHPPHEWLEANLRAGARLGYSPWLHTVDGAERLDKAVRGSRREPRSRDRQSDRRDLDRPAAAALGAVVLHDLRYAGESAPRSSRACRRDSRRLQPTRSWSATRTPSPGCSTSAAAMFRTRRCALAFALLPREGRPRLFVDGRKLDNEVRASPRGARRRAPSRRFDAASPRSAAAAKVRLDPSAAPERSRASSPRAAARFVRGADPIAPMKAVKNAAEIAGTRAAHLPRRRGGDALPRLARPRGAAGRPRPRSTPSRRWRVSARDTGAAPGRFLPDHRRRRAERRHRALPRHARRPTAASRRASCSWSIPARNTRTAPPTSPAPSRSARRAPEMRDRFTRVLKGHLAIARAVFPRAPPARSSMPSRALRSGRPGSISTTAPATASAATSRCTRGRSASPSSARAPLKPRHDPLERARLLQGGRLRHPHREPGPGVEAAAVAGGETPDARLRDPDARARSTAA